MLKISYKVFRGQFLPTFDKLMGTPGLNARVAYNVSKMSPHIKKAASQAQQEFLDLVNKYAIKDESGAIKPHEGPGTFEIAPENRPEWEKAIVEFENKEATIDRSPFMVSDLAQANLTPLEYEALDPILVDLQLAAQSG